jgi:hypothetical protein
MILEKVSFDPNLFRNELYKAFRELVPDEIYELKKWCIATFGWNYCVTAAPVFSV